MPLLLFAVGCTAGLRSSALVGAQGAALAEHARATETALLCDLGRALLPTEQASCQAWTKKTSDRKVALRILASYGKALRQLSTLPDPDTADAAEGMVSALDALSELEGAPLAPGDKSDFKAALTGLASFVSRAQRASVITKVVREADSSVRELVETLELQLELREDYLRTLDAKLDAVLAASFESGSEARSILPDEVRTARSPEELPEPGHEPECRLPRLVSNNATDRLAFAEVRHHISILIEANQRARRDLRAFGSTHRKLAAESRRLKGEDAELARDLALDLRHIYSAVESNEDAR